MFKIGNKSIIGTVVATVVMACVTSTASQATIYNVSEAVGSGNDHAFWLPTVNSWLGLGTHDFGVVNATFDWDRNGGVGSVAKLRGTIQSQNDAGKKFDLFFDFAYRGLGAEGTDGPKCELGACSGVAYTNAGVIPTDDWDFFDLLPNANLAELVGSDDLLGLDLSVTEAPSPGRLPFQFGTCANGKNCGLGASVWLNYTILANTQGVTNTSGHALQVGATGYGDININLTPVDVPEPGTLALFGLGLVGLRFAKRKKTL